MKEIAANFVYRINSYNGTVKTFVKIKQGGKEVLITRKEAISLLRALQQLDIHTFNNNE